ncbi:MAG: hypothetical protein KDD62_05360, partial [Bdellovibrionales bacterium]|nr:hypothetical protein [Bdellovibrionales bacterium]
VSTSVKSDFIFVDSMRNVNPRLAGAVQIPVLSHLQVAEDTLQAGLQEEATWALSVLSDVNPEMVVCNYLMRPFLEPLLQERLHCASRAESLGTESFIALDYAFKNLEKGQSCAIVSAGVGSCSTIVLFRKE